MDAAAQQHHRVGERRIQVGDLGVLAIGTLRRLDQSRVAVAALRHVDGGLGSLLLLLLRLLLVVEIGNEIEGVSVAKRETRWLEEPRTRLALASALACSFLSLFKALFIHSFIR